MAGIGIGLLGYGGIGKVHTLAYREIPYYYPGQLPELSLAAVCTARRESAEAAARLGGFARAYTSVEELVADPAVTVVDCSLPNSAHKPALLAALAAGKHVYCEKPLAVNADDAREIAKAAARSGGRLGMTFNYRYIPAVMRAKQLLSDGALGEIYSYHFEYLHTGYQDPTRPLSWRMSREASGGGALFDLGSHVIDLARYLLGEFESLFATAKTYVTERPLASGSAEMGQVTVDDAMWLQVRLAGGVPGTIHVSRFSTGALDGLQFRVEGRKGALRFDLMDGNWLYWFDATRKAGGLGGDLGWQRLETVHQYPGAVIPPGRTILGWTRTHAECQYSFLKAVASGAQPSPGIADGLAVQLVLDAAYASAEGGGWRAVERI